MHEDVLLPPKIEPQAIQQHAPSPLAHTYTHLHSFLFTHQNNYLLITSLSYTLTSYLFKQTYILSPPHSLTNIICAISLSLLHQLIQLLPLSHIHSHQFLKYTFSLLSSHTHILLFRILKQPHKEKRLRGSMRQETLPAVHIQLHAAGRCCTYRCRVLAAQVISHVCHHLQSPLPEKCTIHGRLDSLLACSCWSAVSLKHYIRAKRGVAWTIDEEKSAGNDPSNRR